MPEMPEDPLRSAIDAIRSRLHDELEAQLTQLSTRQHEELESARAGFRCRRHMSAKAVGAHVVTARLESRGGAVRTERNAACRRSMRLRVAAEPALPNQRRRCAIAGTGGAHERERARPSSRRARPGAVERNHHQASRLARSSRRRASERDSGVRTRQHPSSCGRQRQSSTTRQADSMRQDSKHWLTGRHRRSATAPGSGGRHAPELNALGISLRTGTSRTGERPSPESEELGAEEAGGGGRFSSMSIDSRHQASSNAAGRAGGVGRKAAARGRRETPPGRAGNVRRDRCAAALARAHGTSETAPRFRGGAAQLEPRASRSPRGRELDTTATISKPQTRAG